MDDEARELFDSRVMSARLPRGVVTSRGLDVYERLPGNRAAVAACMKFLTEEREHFFLTLAAEVGRGKTHLAIATLIEWIKRGNFGVFYESSVLLDEIRRAYDGAEGLNYHAVMRSLKTVPLLVIDDLGTEKSTEWAREKMDELINDRYLNERLVIFTTNLKPDQLGPRIASRMQEGVVITLSGEDYRKLKAERRKSTEVKK